MSVDCEGWLQKKNAKRYFILRENVLYWFTYHLQDLSGDLASKAKGSLNLENCEIKLPSEPNKKFCLEIIGPVENYLLKARDDADASNWLVALTKAVEGAQKRTEGMGKYLKTGWMEKKGQRRWFVLKEDTLSWYLNEQVAKPKGTLDLKQCRIGPAVLAPDLKGTFTITAPYKDNAQYKLVCVNGIEDAKAWVESILSMQGEFQKKQAEKDIEIASSVSSSQDIQKEGWLEKKGKRRFFKLFNFLLTWYTEDPKGKFSIEINGSLNLKGCQLAHTGFTFTIKPTVGASYELRAPTVEEAENWVSTIKAAAAKQDTERKISMFEASKRDGWLTRLPVGKNIIGERKTQKLFVRIEQTGDLKFYETDMWQSKAPITQIHLACCAVTPFNETTFMIGTGFGKDIPLQCADVSERDQWMTTLQFYIQKANEEMNNAVTKHQFLFGGRTQNERWIVITKDKTTFMWFDKVVAPASITTANANGSLKILSCQMEHHPERQLTFNIWDPAEIDKNKNLNNIKNVMTDKIKFTATEKLANQILNEKYTFTAPDQQSYDSWYNMLFNIQHGREPTASDIPKKPGLVFGVPLETLLERDGTPVPKLVMKCAEYVLKYGTDVQGIFRLSGQAGQIAKYTEEFDLGEDVEFPPELDVHVVTGILKSWLRALPEPALPCDLYNDFLAAAALSESLIKTVLNKVPPKHLDLVSYLCKFLNHMCKYGSITSMEAPNIAIVFGPNMLRRRDDNSAAGLAETPMVLKVIQVLITNYYQLFPNEAVLDLPPVNLPPSGPPPTGPPSSPPPSGPPPPTAAPPTGPPPSTPPGPRPSVATPTRNQPEPTFRPSVSSRPSTPARPPQSQETIIQGRVDWNDYNLPEHELETILDELRSNNDEF
eukprot:TRINITY_DN11255_c0_g1_i1.p1 TRINITY_DN11255_c0_g1~~TRINITY_DN11255_c0_g1_i1.p1  ORF type:complete len:883 (-),score=257.20 TRINITY_DN11255_c0_g1_i1:510-3158(-)